ncbi:hypothetical protein TWF106_007429 [Orbilia oligospora]|uniref:Uncharacterized protein n=1 Tax=Orbilia oligospora TaxID=2813651 RepID=A0A7C8UZJ6_ORBOL|nr:hypothetical protein TWF106_007429 [Orbilia oligospora]
MVRRARRAEPQRNPPPTSRVVQRHEIPQLPVAFMATYMLSMISGAAAYWACQRLTRPSGETTAIVIICMAYIWAKFILQVIYQNHFLGEWTTRMFISSGLAWLLYHIYRIQMMAYTFDDWKAAQTKED